MNNVLNKLDESWNCVKQIVIYGLGRTAERNVMHLMEDFKIIGIVDNNREGQYEDIPIQKQEDAIDLLKENKIIVTTSALAYASIKKELEKIGLTEYRDFCRLEDFMVEWYWKNKKEVHLSQTFSPIISNCTFKCKYCNLFMTHYDAEHHYCALPQEIMEDFEKYFQVVDYLSAWSVLGGEPLLNKNLADIIQMVYDKYGEKIGYI